MKISQCIFCILVLVLVYSPSFGQSSDCPPNLDFESGGYGYWKFYTGACCPITTPTAGQVIGRHTLTTGSGLDLYGNFPVVAPNGGVHSLKLGNTLTGSDAERAEYYVHVPAGVNNYSLLYNFAVVFEDPLHAPLDQPRFVVTAIDSATNQPLPCAQYTYVSGSGLPGFSFNSLYQVWYRGWSTASLNLSGYAGHTIIVGFASGDCNLGAHFGYGYVDLACALFEVASVVCNGQPTQTFKAPPGFMTYTWYDSTYVTTIGTGQILTIPTPPQNLPTMWFSLPIRVMGATIHSLRWLQ